MTNPNRKTSTDIHWDNRAASDNVPAEKVNIGDTVQRDLETKFVLSVLPKLGRTLEVGCGNGHLTSILRTHTEFVDAFDYSPNMIAKAKEVTGEKNNRFFVDNLLDIKSAEGPYDAIVCVRVLINLANLDEVKKGIENLSGQLKPGGKLVLVEGYKDGFDEISKLRQQSGLESLTPAAINFYASLAEVEPLFEKYFTIGKTFHTGMFDLLTRVVYPLLVGADKVVEAGDFHAKTLPLTQAFNPESLGFLGRLRGFELTKRYASQHEA